MIKKIEETMTPDLVTVGWDERIEMAYRRMQANRLRHLPVHNENGEVVGMLSDRDVQRAMVSQVDHDSSTALSAETISFDPNSRVRDYMAWPVLSVGKGSDLKAAVALMLGNRVSALLVRDHGRAVGIVTTDDLLKVLTELLTDGAPPRWTLRALVGGAANQGNLMI